jgi:hypothetical protein
VGRIISNILALLLFSHSTNSNATWPFVTVPHFDIVSEAIEKLAGIELVVFAPLVKRTQNTAWAEYAVDNQGWIEEALGIHSLQNANPGKITIDIQPFQDDSTREDHPDIIVPIWQMGPAPTNSSVINIDLYTHPSFQGKIDEVLSLKHGVLSEVANLSFLTESVGNLNDGDHQHSFAVEPVFAGFEVGSAITGFIFAVVSLLFSSQSSGECPNQTDTRTLSADSMGKLLCQSRER